MAKPYADCPIAELALNAAERQEAIAALRDLMLALGAPGDYGYDSKLGRLLQDVNELRREIERTPTREPLAVGG